MIKRVHIIMHVCFVSSWERCERFVDYSSCTDLLDKVGARWLVFCRRTSIGSFSVIIQGTADLHDVAKNSKWIIRVLQPDFQISDEL